LSLIREQSMPRLPSMCDQIAQCSGDCKFQRIESLRANWLGIERFAARAAAHRVRPVI
jgi:hypothetical protein